MHPVDNAAEIKRVLTHPKVFPYVSDDGSPSPEEFEPKADLILGSGDPLAGVVMVEARGMILCEIHVAFLPELYGQATELTREAGLWVFSHTPCLKIVTQVPTYNRLAIRVAEKCGMTKEGINRKSILKNWKLYDQVVYGITKEEARW